MRLTNLVLKVIPPVWPRLLNAPLLLEYGPIDGSAQDTECHGHAMVVVAVDTHALLELGGRPSIHLEAVVKLLSLNPELGCEGC